MARIKLLLIVWIASASLSVAQTNRYMVFFTDKQGTGHTVSNPITFLNERAIARRATQSIEIIAEDLPVTASYIQGVRATGATVLYKTKWMNGVLVECTSAQLATINALSYVKSAETEFVAPGTSGGRYKSNKLKTARTEEDETAEQLAMIGIDEMHTDGYFGEGVIVAVMDGGFLGVNVAPDFQDVFNNQIDQNVSWDFTAHGSDVYKYSDHGTGVLSVISVLKPGEFTGGAYKATFQLYVTEHVANEYRVEEYNWLFAAERADSAGVDVINTSLGYNTFDEGSMDYETEDMDGHTTVITRSAELAASKGIFVVSSAGNSGSDVSWRIITAPADGEHVLAIGNINLQGVKSPTSSIGPAADGRIKPDVVALGVSVSAYFANGTIGGRNGTSFSSPLVAGLVAGLRERYPDVSSAKLMDAIRYSASQAHQPDNLLGYGIPHYRAIVNYLEMQTAGGKRSLIIHPNPVLDTFTFTLTKPVELQLNEIAIVNAQGQRVGGGEMVYNWPDNSYSMDIRHFIPGIYFLSVRVGNKVETYKLVKI